MPSIADRSPSSGRRIFSRIASPFAPKSRNIADFSIKLDDEHKHYSPGDIVMGHVRLRVAKPIRVTHIVVCLHGFAQVYRNPGSPGEGFRAHSGYLGTGRGKKSGEYFGNGFSSLFEDEVVLCGDGRLAEGIYQFNFELEFPDQDLPSSIDFERGTITYMITTTLTRPNTMSPVISHDRKVYFVQSIDVSKWKSPNSRTITLEPISKRGRAKNNTRKLVDASDRSFTSTQAQHHGSNRFSAISSAPSTRADNPTPVSPIPSETSFHSHPSSDRRTSQPDSQPRSSPTASDVGRDNNSKVSLPTSKVITSTIESLAGGCLRGDYIPVKVNVAHTKVVQSVYGVIVTLFRVARVDMRPAIPLGPTEKGKNAKYEDYYPKSITGLGGLSLSGAGSTHVYRKDLSQAMSPLYVNAQTLTADVQAKVRVPEEAFPTISTVPGAMISFKYYVEVIVDIQGKLSGQEKALSTLAGQAAPAGHVLSLDGSNMERSALTPYGSTIVDTVSIRRDKSVVNCTFEVIIGTTDSERRKGKRRLEDAAAEPQTSDSQTHERIHEQRPEARAHYHWRGPNASYDDYWYQQQDAYHYPPPDEYHSAYHERPYMEPPPMIPIPDVPDESQMTEKERIRHAETRLLPSQPPGMDEAGEDSVVGATAPYLPEEAGDDHIAGQNEVSHSNHEPEYQPAVASSSAQAILPPSDDKQEVQQQQLQAEASAPMTDVEEHADHLHASAPTLADVDGAFEDIHISHADAPSSSGLPRYER